MLSSRRTGASRSFVSRCPRDTSRERARLIIRSIGKLIAPSANRTTTRPCRSEEGGTRARSRTAALPVSRPERVDANEGACTHVTTIASRKGTPCTLAARPLLVKRRTNHLPRRREYEDEQPVHDRAERGARNDGDGDERHYNAH